MEIDWMQCELIESVEGKCGGQPVVKGTRVFPQPLVNSFEMGDTLEEVQEGWPSLTLNQIARLIDFARDWEMRAAA